MDETTITLRVLLLKEADIWVAQCLEYDVCGQGKEIDGALLNLEAAFVGHLVLDERDKRAPLSYMKPAPEEYWALYQSAQVRENARPFMVPDRADLPPEIAEAMPPLWARARPTAEVRVC